MLGTAASAGADRAAGAAGVRGPAYAQAVLVSAIPASVILDLVIPASAQATVLVQAVMAPAQAVLRVAMVRARAVMAQAVMDQVLADTVRVATAITDGSTPASLNIRSAAAGETIG